MGRLFFTPFSIAAGLLAGFLGKTITEQVWGWPGEEEPERG